MLPWLSRTPPSSRLPLITMCRREPRASCRCCSSRLPVVQFLGSTAWSRRGPRRNSSTKSQMLDSSGISTRSPTRPRSEEHTSELQSRGHIVCRLLLEKKKKKYKRKKKRKTDKKIGE